MSDATTPTTTMLDEDELLDAVQVLREAIAYIVHGDEPCDGPHTEAQELKHAVALAAVGAVWKHELAYMPTDSMRASFESTAAKVAAELALLEEENDGATQKAGTS